MLLKRFFVYVLVFFICVVSQPLLAANTSGLPIPRWTVLKSDEVNVRTGPGTRYPIQWVYHRDGLPVEVIEEYDLWRKIRDAEGTTGWVHKTMLEGKRNVMIRGRQAQVLRIDSRDDSKPVLKAEPSVIGKLIECEKDWCRVQVSGHRGWIAKKYIWGVYPDEIIN